MKNQPLLYRLQYAWTGIITSWHRENSFRVHVTASIFVLVVLCLVRPEPVWWAMLLLTCGLVLTLELVNTAIERLADHLHPEIHPALKTTKDALAGAVLVASLVAILIFIAFLIEAINL